MRMIEMFFFFTTSHKYTNSTCTIIILHFFNKVLTGNCNIFLHFRADYDIRLRSVCEGGRMFYSLTINYILFFTTKKALILTDIYIYICVRGRNY